VAVAVAVGGGGGGGGGRRRRRVWWAGGWVGLFCAASPRASTSKSKACSRIHPPPGAAAPKYKCARPLLVLLLRLVVVVVVVVAAVTRSWFIMMKRSAQPPLLFEKVFLVCRSNARVRACVRARWCIRNDDKTTQACALVTIHTFPCPPCPSSTRFIAANHHCSTPQLATTTSTAGLPFSAATTGTFSIIASTSSPSTIRPNSTCFPDDDGDVAGQTHEMHCKGVALRCVRGMHACMHACAATCFVLTGGTRSHPDCDGRPARIRRAARDTSLRRGGCCCDAVLEGRSYDSGGQESTFQPTRTVQLRALPEREEELAGVAVLAAVGLFAAGGVGGGLLCGGGDCGCCGEWWMECCLHTRKPTPEWTCHRIPCVGSARGSVRTITTPPRSASGAKQVGTKEDEADTHRQQRHHDAHHHHQQQPVSAICQRRCCCCCRRVVLVSGE
jgi:hypothetical protein